VPDITLAPFSVDDARAVLAGQRAAAWAIGYPTAGDLVVATRITEGSMHPVNAEFLWGPWAVWSGDTVIGGAGFHAAPDDTGAVEIGYGIAEEWRGRGVATIAVLELLRRARDHGAARVVAGTDPANAASQRVLEKAGFTRAGFVEEENEVRWAIEFSAEEHA